MNSTFEHITAEQLSFLKGISTPYSSVLLVDLSTHEYLVVKMLDQVQESGLLVHSYREDFEALLNYTVHPNYFEAVREFFALDNVAARLSSCDKSDSLLFMSILPGREWVSASWKCALRDENAVCTYAYLTIRDFDMDQKIQLDNISKTNDIVQSAGMGVWEIFFNGDEHPRLRASRQMARLLGLGEESHLTEEEAFDYLVSRISEKSVKDFMTYDENLKKGKRDECTYIWNHPTLGERYVRCGGVGTKLSENQYAMHGYHYDVTEQVLADREKEDRYLCELEKARETAEAANAAKTTFLFNMSHDIRTPMNAIIGYTHLLDKNQEDPQKRADYLAKIDKSSTVLLSILNNVLEMARIEKGAVAVEETPWSVEQFLDMLSSIFHESMMEKGLEFVQEHNVDHPFILCDTTKVREIFMNIISNAVKYTPHGGKISMKLSELPSEREGYVFFRTVITDTGIGMSEEFLPKIFNEFSREHDSSANNIEGTGLGMSIVKRLVNLLEGTIEIQSKLGEGTSVSITLPHKITDGNSMSKVGKKPVNTTEFAKKRILLAEDNDLNAEISMEILEEVGFEVERAEDGLVCVDMINNAESGYYDVILMDIQMPNMNGYDATRAIRGLKDKKKAEIPILAMTANAFEEDRREALNAGMNEHLSKPVEPSKLFKALNAAILEPKNVAKL